MVLVTTGTITKAQTQPAGEPQQPTSPFEISLGADFMSRYIWRGSDFGQSPSIQPTLKVSAKGFTLGAWGAFTTSNTTPAQETDLYLSYTTPNNLLTFATTDYFFPNEAVAKNHYFNYNKNETGHIMEGSISLNPSAKLPIGLLAGYNFYGSDKNNSVYLELLYNATLNGVPLSVFCGGTTDKGIYGTEAGVVNLGVKTTKEVKITETFKLPISASFITNPQTGNVFLVFGLTL
jgi:Bacterial protein of unknown function (Gcw_chp).